MYEILEILEIRTDNDDFPIPSAVYQRFPENWVNYHTDKDSGGEIRHPLNWLLAYPLNVEVIDEREHSPELFGNHVISKSEWISYFSLKIHKFVNKITG